MAAGYSVTFSIVDEASGQIDKITRRIKDMRSPLDRMQRQTQNIVDPSMLRRVSEGFGQIGRSAGDAFSSLARMIPAMGALTGAASIAGLAALTRSAADLQQQLRRNASEINTSADQLERLQSATRLAGGNADTMTQSLKDLSQVTQQIVTGQNPLAEAAFRKAGISYRDANNHLRDSTEILPEIINYLNKEYPNAQDRAQVATQLGGRSLHQLNEDFRASGRMIDDWMRRQERLGLGLSGRQRESLRQYGQEVGQLNETFRQLGDQIGATFADIITPQLRSFNIWFEENGEPIKTTITDIGEGIQGWDALDLGNLLELFRSFGDAIKRVDEFLQPVADLLNRLSNPRDLAVAQRAHAEEFTTALAPTTAAAPAAPAAASEGGGGIGGWWRRMRARAAGGVEALTAGTPAGAAAPTAAANENVAGGARGAVEAYLGKPISDREYDSLLRATHAESGVRNSPEEQAMIMGSVLNRARTHPGGIEGALTAKNQFQAVTGTRNAPGPSANYLQGPSEARRAHIEGAATSLLSRVPTSQTNFTAADPRAYGAGTNVGYLSTLRGTSGGARYGGTQFGGALLPDSTGGIPQGGGGRGAGGSGGAGDGQIPANLLATAQQHALQGGPQAVDKFLRSQGYNRPSAWCGAFAASVVKSQGIEPPKNPLVASNWRNWGEPVQGTPEGGHVAIRRGAATGQTGSHVTFVENVDPRTGTFTSVGGNQGLSKAQRMQGLTGRSTYNLADFDFRQPQQAENIREIAGGAEGKPAEVTGGPSVSGSVDVTVTHRNPPPGTTIEAKGRGDVDVPPPRTEQQQLTAA